MKKGQPTKAKYKKPKTNQKTINDQGQPIFDAPQHPNHQAFKIKNR